MKESKDRERARELFNKAIEFDKNFSKVHNSLGVLLYSRYNEYDAARTSYLRAIEIHPKNPWFHNNLAALERKCGNYDHVF